MKITVNGKKFELGKACDLMSCKVGLEKACELAGIPVHRVVRATCKQKDGTIIDLVKGMKCIAWHGSSFNISMVDAGNEEK